MNLWWFECNHPQLLQVEGSPSFRQDRDRIIIEQREAGVRRLWDVVGSENVHY